MTTDERRIELSDVGFDALDAPAALDALQRLYERPEPAWAAHANVHTVNLAWGDPRYRAALDRADLVLNDGKGVMLGARIKGSRFPADLNGNFVAPLVLTRAAEEGWPVYFFGAAPGVAELAAQRVVQGIPGLKIVGTRNGFFTPGEEASVIENIRASGAGLLLVGLGNPRQEVWLDRNLAATGARLGIGVGAFFDFEAGAVKRAPGWMNKIGVEWLHRLLVEPRRMWRRYLIGNPQFLWRTLKERR